MSRTRATLLGAALVVLTMAACAQPNLPLSTSSGGSTEASSQVAVTVTLVHSSFGPSLVTINPGQTVRWVWDDGGVPHNVTFATVHSATMTSGTWSRTFYVPGVYHYRCTLHANMVGTVVVRGAAGRPAV